MKNFQFLAILVFFTVEFFNISYVESVQCYICVWSNASGDPTPKIDNCRTGKFRSHELLVDNCQHGCSVSMIHEYEPEKNASKQIAQSTRCTYGRKMPNMTMTLFTRICAERLVTKPHCKVATMAGFHSEERLCRTDYCNGESGVGEKSLSQVAVGVCFLLFLATFACFHQPNPKGVFTITTTRTSTNLKSET